MTENEQKAEFMRERTIVITAFRVFALYCLYHSLCGGLNNLATAISTWVLGQPTSTQTKYLLSSSAAPLTGLLFGIIVWLLAGKLAGVLDSHRSK